jgi:hypothetical protein
MKTVRALLIGCAFLLACESTPEKTAYKPEPDWQCHDTGCAIIAGAILLVGAGLDPHGRTNRESYKHSIYGRCEILIENEIPREQKHPIPQPCSQVELTVTTEGKEERSAWIDGFEFEIPQLNKTSYRLEAYSEQVGTRAFLDGVKPGQWINIQLKLPKRPALAR